MHSATKSYLIEIQMSREQKVFQTIPRSHERDLLLSEFASLHCDVYIKFSDSKTLLTKIKKWIPPFKLQLQYPSGVRPVVQKQLSVQINDRGDRYFAQAYVQDTGSEFFLVIEGPLYKVQRRQSFRLRLPQDYPATSSVFELNGHVVNEKVKLIDISEGGCSAEVPLHLGCEMGSQIGLRMKIGSRGEFTEYGHITYSKIQKDKYQLGIKFSRTQDSNSELFSLVRDLYVELFSKWSRRR